MSSKLDEPFAQAETHEFKETHSDGDPAKLGCSAVKGGGGCTLPLLLLHCWPGCGYIPRRAWSLIHCRHMLLSPGWPALG